MAPGIIWYQCEFLVLRFQLALLVEIQCLGAGGQRLYRGTGNLSPAEDELRSLIKQSAHDIEVGVGVLGTIDQRTSLHTHHATVGLYLVVRADGACLHVKMYLHLVALLPLTVDGVVTILRQPSIHIHSIHFHGVAQALVV